MRSVASVDVPSAPFPTTPRPPWTAWAAAALLVLLLLPKIGAGTLWHHDELLTANRAREMLVRGDFSVVTVNFVPSVKKPPLQYWVCAALLRLLPTHPELALRLPTLLAGAGCLLAAAWLARVYFPDDAHRHLPAWTVLTLATCGYLIHFSRVALLDTGAALFLTLALAGCRLARRDARWWWFVALTCVLGAWQKAPYGLAAWVVVLLLDRRTTAETPATRRWHHHLPTAFLATVAGSFAWWLLQWLHHEHALLTAGREQIGNFLRAHDPADEGFRPWLYWVWLARDWALPGLCAPVAALAATRHRERAALGWTCVAFGIALACLVYRAERYLVVVTPVLAVLTVDLCRRVTKLPWLLPLVIATTLPVAMFQYFKPAPASPDLRDLAQELGREARPDERLLVSIDADEDFDTAGFVLFYADLRRPLTPVVMSYLTVLPAELGPCRGICSRTQWEQLSSLPLGLRETMTRGEWVLWER